MHYEDLENLPFRASMRRSTKTGYWHDTYGSKIRGFYVWLHAFLRSSIGKSFNDAYSILCKKYPSNIGWLSPKDQFKWRFDDSPGYSRYGYYVDEEGIIRYRRLRSPKKISITVPTSKARQTYKVNSRYGSVKDILWTLPYSRRTIVEVTGRITFDEYISIRNSRYWEEAKLILEEMDDSEYETAWKGCRRYSQLRAEKKSKQRKSERERKELLRKRLEEDCSWQFRGHKIRTKEMQKIAKAAQKREELQNLIDRDRLGFGEESFMGSNYNSRKGRKLKRLINDKAN